MRDVSKIVGGAPMTIRNDVVYFTYSHHDDPPVNIEGGLKFENGKAFVQLTKPYTGYFIECGSFIEDSESALLYQRIMNKLVVDEYEYRRMAESFKYIEDNFTRLDEVACALAVKYSKYEWITFEEFFAIYDDCRAKKTNGLISEDEYYDIFDDALDKQDKFRKIRKAFPRNYEEACSEDGINGVDINKVLYLRRKRRLNEVPELSEFMKMDRDAVKILFDEDCYVGTYIPLESELCLLLRNNRMSKG